MRKKESKLHIEAILESGKGAKQINKMNSSKTRITQLKKKDGSTTSDREEMLHYVQISIKNCTVQRQTIPSQTHQNRQIRRKYQKY